jgi:hypothetical protein
MNVIARLGSIFTPDSPERYLAAAQRKEPWAAVGARHDSGPRLYADLEQRLPLQVRQLFESKQIVIGELGVLKPDAFIEPVARAGYAIQIYTGLSRFLFRVNRALATNVRVFDPESEPNEEDGPPLAQWKTALIVEEVFRSFMETERIGGPSGYPISRRQIEWASALTTCAEQFAVAHEIAHAINWRARGLHFANSSPEDELEADKLALMFVLGIAGAADVTRAFSQRMAYAGAECLVRIFACLEHLGYDFRKSHPLPSNRLANLRAVAAELTFGLRGFMSISTVAFANDQLLENVELRFAMTDKTFVLGVTPERLLSTVSVLVEESLKGNATQESIVTQITDLFEHAPESVVRDMIGQARKMYFTEPLINATDADRDVAKRQRALLRSLAESLPPRWAQMMRDALPVGPDSIREINIVPTGYNAAAGPK